MSVSEKYDETIAPHSYTLPTTALADVNQTLPWYLLNWSNNTTLITSSTAKSTQ
jgi:hypothetical protein